MEMPPLELRRLVLRGATQTQRLVPTPVLALQLAAGRQACRQQRYHQHSRPAAKQAVAQKGHPAATWHQCLLEGLEFAPAAWKLKLVAPSQTLYCQRILQTATANQRLAPAAAKRHQELLAFFVQR